MNPINDELIDREIGKLARGMKSLLRTRDKSMWAQQYWLVMQELASMSEMAMEIHKEGKR